MTVALRKMRPPVTHDLEYAGVRVTRRRGLVRCGPLSGSDPTWAIALGYLRRAVVGLARRGGGVVGVRDRARRGAGGPGPVPQRGGRARHRPVAPRSCSRSADRLEEAAGRARTVRFGPRTLDVDVLLVGDLAGG